MGRGNRQKGHAEGQQTYEKMLNITHHHGNQNHNETAPHTSQNGYHQYSNKQALVGMWRRGNPCVLMSRLQIGAATWGEAVWFPQAFLYLLYILPWNLI